jgi:GTPase
MNLILRVNYYILNNMDYFINSEKYWGNIEYKINFINMTPDKIKKYATQLKFRIVEGGGKAIYMIGVFDNGKVIGIKNKEVLNCTNIMNKMCHEINATLKSNKIINLDNENNLLIFVIENNFNIESIPYLFG